MEEKYLQAIKDFKPKVGNPDDISIVATIRSIEKLVGKKTKISKPNQEKIDQLKKNVIWRVEMKSQKV